MYIRRTVIAIVVLTLCLPALPAVAQGNWQPGDFGGLRLRLGLFEPDGDSQFWDEKLVDWTGDAGELEDFSFGIDYLWSTSRNAGVLFGFAHYDGSATHAYRDWEDFNGNDVSHTSRLDTTELTVAYVLHFGDRTARISPYIGGGVGLVWWSFEEQGYFIDFTTDDYEIFSDRYSTSDTTWQAFAVAGLNLPVTPYWGFLVEGRWKYMEDEMSDDFAGFGTIDLSGWELSVGVAWSF